MNSDSQTSSPGGARTARRWLALLTYWIALATAGLALVAPAGIVHAAPQLVESIVVKLQGEAPQNDAAALAAAMRTTFSIVGQTRDGALRLEFQRPLPVAEARAAVNRVRLLPQVVYASIAGVVGEPATDGASVGASAAPPQPRVTRLIIKYRDEAQSNAAMRNEPPSAFAIDRIASSAGQPVVHERAMSGGAYVVRLFQSLPVDEARALARHLEQDAAIEYAEPDLMKQPVLVPNDPLYASQWNYQSPPTEMGGVNLPPAWALTTGSASVTAAVLDTGSLPNHPDLAGRYVGGYDFVHDVLVANDGNARDSDPTDPGDWVTAAEAAFGQYFYGCSVRGSTFHGTHVAGTIGAASNNSVGVAGVNWISKVVPLRVLGKCGGYDSDIADAIRWAAGLSVPGVPQNPNPAWVMNLSLGGYACDGNGLNCACDNATQSAIDAAVSAGAVVVVAAGNSNRPAIESSPANCNGVITVGATGRQGQRASYSNYGPLVEISAPGGSDSFGVLSTLNDGATVPDPQLYSYRTYFGTSMATPHITGIVSLMLSRNPSLTPAQVMSILQTTARPFPTGTVRDCTTALCGAGIVDAGAAVAAADGGPLPPAPTATTLASSANPSLAGASVTFTATVTGTNNPTGNVSFTDGGNPISGCTSLPFSVGSGNTRTAACGTALSAGTHPIVATYSGDAANATSTSSGLSQVVNSAGSTNVALAANGGVATSSSSYASGTTPPGAINGDRKGLNWNNGGGWKSAAGMSQWLQVQFASAQSVDRVVLYDVQDNYTNPVEPTDSMTNPLYGSSFIDFTVAVWVNNAWVTVATVTNNNLVKRTVTFPAVATDRIRATITRSADAYARLTEIEAFTAAAQDGPAPTATTLASSANPSLAGASVTFTATVTGTNNPTGNVSFTDGGNPISGCTTLAFSAGSGNTRTAACGTALSAGTHPIVASYAGDAANATSTSSALSQTVNPAPPAPTATTLASSANPSVAGASVTFTATVTGTNNPTGNVSFTDGGNPISGCTTLAFSAGSGNTRTAACGTALSAGTHPIVASYAGDAANATSTSSALSQAVNPAPPAPTATTLGSSANPSLAGASVTFTATVTGTNNPTGNVSFTDGGNPISGCTTLAFSAGSGNTRTAACGTALSAGTHPIVATYLGDAANATSTSSALSQVVNPAPPAPTATALGSSANPSVAGASVTFTATVTGTNNPTGNVSFTDNGNPISGCTNLPFTAGSGNIRTAACGTTLAAGTHPIVATYLGDAANATSTSSALSQVVNGAAGSTNVALAANGGTATSSSNFSSGTTPPGALNGDRKGLNWNNGGGWKSAAGLPQWLQVQFAGTQTIDRVVLYDVQDNYLNPVEPTDTMTNPLYGSSFVSFTASAWINNAWVDVAAVNGNNLVKRTVTFPAVTTDRIRLTVTQSADAYARLAEIEVWTQVIAGPQLAAGIPGVLEKVVTDAVTLPRVDGLAFDRFGNLFGVLEVVNPAGGVVYIDKATGAVQPIALGIPGACRVHAHANGDLYVSSELPITTIGGITVQLGGLYRVVLTYNGANRPVSGIATKLATVLDSPEGIQQLPASSAYGVAGAMFIAEDEVGGRIVRVMPDGSGLTEWIGAAANLQKTEGLEFGDFNGAQPAALYAAEKAGGRIMRIGADRSVTTLGNPAAVGGLNGPDNIAFGPDGYLYVGEKYGGRIIRIAGDGTHTVYATGFDNVEGVAFDPITHDLYIGEIEKSTVWRVRG